MAYKDKGRFANDSKLGTVVACVFLAATDQCFAQGEGAECGTLLQRDCTHHFTHSVREWVSTDSSVMRRRWDNLPWFRVHSIAH
jgi:hypothetical protein